MKRQQIAPGLSQPISPVQERVLGLDTIRAVSAFWVVMGHLGGPPITSGIDESNFVARVVGGIYNNFFNGPAAVIIFFVVSGFCIHFPHSRTNCIPNLPEYFLRRFTRICIPLFAAVLFSKVVQVDLSFFNLSILWSLIAELVYYSIYPAVLMMRRKGVSWQFLLIASYLSAFALASTDITAKNYPSYGVSWNWLLGLPCWLLGCFLADLAVSKRLAKTSSIGSWRFLVFVAATTCNILRFHSPIGYPWTLNFFAIVAFLWLGREIEHHKTNKCFRWFEWSGSWSYSVYLFHLLAHSMLIKLALPNFGHMLNWIIMMIFIGLTSYLFYTIVERPSHLLARKIAKYVARPNIACSPNA